MRRTTHENVDLNRNFQDFSQPLPVNEAYREVQPLLAARRWPPSPHNQAATWHVHPRRGEAAYQAAITRGQHEFADGLFFGGTSPTWSNQTLRHGAAPARPAGQRGLAGSTSTPAWDPTALGERIFAGGRR